MHIEGAMGDYALAKYLGLFWAGKGRLKAPDVGELEVRTATTDNRRLILTKNDPDDWIFWLVCGNNGRYSIKGWILASDGKRAEFWTDPTGDRQPAYFVPQSELNTDKTMIKW